MQRWLIPLILAALIGSNAWLIIENHEQKIRFANSAKGMTEVASEARQSTEIARAAATAIAGLKSIPSGAPAAQPMPAQTPGRSIVSQLSLAQSYKLDRVVDWIGLIEDKIFFILFPPPDPSDKERQALELQRRADTIRADFQAVALQELELRNQVMRRLNESSAQK